MGTQSSQCSNQTNLQVMAERFFPHTCKLFITVNSQDLFICRIVVVVHKGSILLTLQVLQKVFLFNTFFESETKTYKASICRTCLYFDQKRGFVHPIQNKEWKHAC